MNRENGESEFVEYVTKPVRHVAYGDHAVNEIRRRLDEGEIPEKGMSAWY